jgi:hypothetical protein
MIIKTAMSEYGGTFISNTGSGYDRYKIVGGNKKINSSNNDYDESDYGGSMGMNGGSAENFLISVIALHNQKNNSNKKTKPISDEVLLGDFAINKKSKDSLSLQTILFGGKKSTTKEDTKNKKGSSDNAAEPAIDTKKEKINAYYNSIKGRGSSLANQLMTMSQYESETTMN